MLLPLDAGLGAAAVDAFVEEVLVAGLPGAWDAGGDDQETELLDFQEMFERVS